MINKNTTKTKIIQYLKTLLILICTALSTAACIPPSGKKIVKVNFIDFAPEDGDYNLNWPGPPRRAWTEADKEFYSVTMELDTPAPESFSLGMYVKEDISFWSDPELGFFMAYFRSGEKKAVSSFEVNNNALPRFWLVCTKLGKVKGSLGKGDDRQANIYLENLGLVSDVERTDWSLDVTATRYEHGVYCK